MARAVPNDQAVISAAIDFVVRAHASFLMTGVHLDRTNQSSHLSKQEERDFLEGDPAKRARGEITHSNRTALVVKVSVLAVAIGAALATALGFSTWLPIIGTFVLAATAQIVKYRAFEKSPGKELQDRFDSALGAHVASRGLGLDELFDMKSRDFEDLRQQVARDAKLARHTFIKAFAVNQRLRIDLGCRQAALTPQGVSAIEAAIAVLGAASNEPSLAYSAEPVLQLDQPPSRAQELSAAPLPSF